MTVAYNVVDADGHVLEPIDLWDHYIDPKFWDRRPQRFIDHDGKDRLKIDGKAFGGKKGLGALGAIGARDGVVLDDAIAYEEGRPGGFDPHKRIPDMDLDGIDAAFLYPSLCLGFGGVEDPELAAALYRSYNRWLADYCKPYPDRLFGVAMLPLQSVPAAIDEMRFARKELGFKAAFIRPNPYNNKQLHHPDYEPFWAAAEDLDMAIGLHEGSSLNQPTVGVDRFETRGAQHIISHPMEMMLACLSVIWGGVVERHPKLRIRLPGVGRRLGRALARPYGSALRRPGLQRFRPEDPTQRIVPAQLLDLVRAGRGEPKGVGRLYRPAPDHVGNGLPAPRRLLPRRTEDG